MKRILRLDHLENFGAVFKTDTIYFIGVFNLSLFKEVFGLL